MAILSQATIRNFIHECDNSEMRIPALANHLNCLNASLYIDKLIKWTAPAYHGNYDYVGYSIITSVDLENYKPLDCTHIAGDRLEHAFTTNGENLFYSDADRYITFQIINIAD